ncbi:HAD family hydrolase [Hydrogenimonas cancrithermarum]|uniref:Haloacid dehalogenase n=1 Tax=Hydrogenimonas cancrithermarum TaxID=2993563 RepID=A0ABN6WXU7_9BACT|nr:HAD family hydrolase [Hydrogenimonas cancrithermarum]BDY13903.1 haloacid dehalogenase [Hydrogenimonas cancrithermarum]
MKQFYLTDLDKTFLRTDLSISHYSRKVWNEAVERGEKLSIATARSYTGVRKLLKELHLKEPLILLDGVMIASPEGELLHVSALNREIGDEIIETGYKVGGLYPLLVGLDDEGIERFVYPKHRNHYQEELLGTYHNDRRVLDADPLRAMKRNLKIVYMESEDVTAELERALKERFGGTIEIKRSKDPYMDCWFMTVLHAEGDKVHALMRLEEIEEVDRDHTTVFGDSHNDLGLFTAAGRKIAVANAIDELKASADEVLPWTNDEDAVARFLEKEFSIG